MSDALSQKMLSELYVEQGLSAAQIAKLQHCSEHKVHYWLKHHNIPKRTISEAVYRRHNPAGDPFTIRKPISSKDFYLLGLGVGLYWGEGTKSSKSAVRLGNTDPALIAAFVEFLEAHCGVKRVQLKFGLQIFSDMSKTDALSYWQKKLGVQRDQFYKTVVTGTQSIGTYRNKTKHGVLTIYFNNTRLKQYLCKLVAEQANIY